MEFMHPLRTVPKHPLTYNAAHSVCLNHTSHEGTGMGSVLYDTEASCASAGTLHGTPTHRKANVELSFHGQLHLNRIVRRT